MNNGFAYCFEEARTRTTGVADLEHNKYVENVSTIMRVLTRKDGDLLTLFDKINKTQAEIKNTSSKHKLINGHEEAERGKTKVKLALEHTFGFCKTFEKITKNFGFLLTFKTADTNDIIYTTIGDPITVTIFNFDLHVPIFIPSAQTQAKFNEFFQNNFKSSFDSWYTGRKLVNYVQEFQVDIGSAQNVKSPKHLRAPHRSLARIGVPKQAKNIANFDKSVVRKYFVEIEGFRYPTDLIITDSSENDFIDQYRDLKVFC